MPLSGIDLRSLGHPAVVESGPRALPNRVTYIQYSVIPIIELQGRLEFDEPSLSKQASTPEGSPMRNNAACDTCRLAVGGSTDTEQRRCIR